MLSSFSVSIMLSTAALGLWAAPSQARNGGMYLQLAPGWGFYDTDEVIIEKDDGEGGSIFPLGDFTPQLKLGFTLFGWAGVETDIAAHAWDLGQAERGGGGFVGGTFRIMPLEILSSFLTEKNIPSLVPTGPVSWHDRPFDLALYVGGGYTLVGEDYGYQGSYLKLGGELQYFVTPNFAVGLDFPVRIPFYEPFRYTNYNENRGLCTDGADAFARGGVLVPPNVQVPDAFEFSGNDIKTECTGAAPTALFFAPSLTVTAVFDFGI